jgi:hypothetical protein
MYMFYLKIKKNNYNIDLYNENTIVQLILY